MLWQGISSDDIINLQKLSKSKLNIAQRKPFCLSVIRRLNSSIRLPLRPESWVIISAGGTRCYAILFRLYRICSKNNRIHCRSALLGTALYQMFSPRLLSCSQHQAHSCSLLTAGLLLTLLFLRNFLITFISHLPLVPLQLLPTQNPIWATPFFIV